MKKLFLTFALGLVCLIINAQPSAIYFDELDSKTSVGYGFSNTEHKLMLGVMQYSKKKNFDNFSIRFVDAEGQEILQNIILELDTVYHFNDGKLNYHEADYLLSIADMDYLMNNLRYRDKVIINDTEYNASIFKGVLEGLRDEYRPQMPNRPFMMPANPFMTWFNPNGMAQTMVTRERVNKRTHFTRFFFNPQQINK